MHTVDLQTLKQALSGISNVGQIEHTFTVDGNECVMVPLTADAERDIFEYSQLALEGADPEDKNDQASSISYMDRFKIATVSHTLVAFGGLDLRDVNTIETGQVVNGRPEVVFRYQAVREIVEKWSKPLIEQFFIQFGEMTRRVEEKAAKAVVYEPSDLTAEIERLRDQLKWLADQVERQDNPDENQSKKIRESILESTMLKRKYQESLVRQGRMSPDMVEEVEEEELPEVHETPEAPKAFPDGPRPPMPRPQDRVEPEVPHTRRQDPPPTAGEFQARPSQASDQQPPVTAEGRPAAPPPPRSEQPPREMSFEEQFRQENPDIPPDEDILKYTPTGDSMIGDDEEAAIRAESARLAEQRRRNIERELAEQRAAEEAVEQARQTAAATGEPLDPTLSPAARLFAERHGRLPPHAAAKQTSDQVGHAAAVPDTAPMTAHRPTGNVPTEAYQMTEKMPLTKRTQEADKARAAEKISVDAPTGGEANPRFVGRGQGGGRRRR